MRSQRKIQQLINELNNHYLGKHGVWAIFFEKRNSNYIIKFLVKDLDKHKRYLPKIMAIIKSNLKNLE